MYRMQTNSLFTWTVVMFLGGPIGIRLAAQSQEPATAPEAKSPGARPSEPKAAAGVGNPNLRPLDKVNPIWLDVPNKRVVMVGEVVLRQGQLELFACLKQTKEHEAIVAIPCKAQTVHAGLLACGAISGNPARFAPTYVSARGSEIEVTLFWTDEKGERQRARAQDWVRDSKTGDAMHQPWVFGGSGFWQDEETKQNHYLAEDGDLICVSNFPTAMLDLPVESTAVNEALQFEAFSDRIPPKGTKVTVVLSPKPGSFKLEDARPATKLEGTSPDP